MILFQKKNWVPGVTRNASVFHASLVHAGEQYSKKLWHMPTKDLLYVTLDGRHQMAFFTDTKLSEYEKAVGKIFSTPKQLKWVEKTYKLYGTALLNSCRVLEKDLSLRSFDTFLKDYAILTNGLWLTLIAGRHFHKLLLEKLASIYPNLSKAELDSLAGCLTYPVKHTPLAQSQIALLKIGVEVQNKKTPQARIENLIDKHIKVYGVIPVNYNEDPWTRDDIEAQLKNLLKTNCIASLKSLNASHKKKVQAAKQALRKFPSVQVKHFARLLQSVTLLNEYRKFVFCNASLAHQDIFRRIAKKYRLEDWRECLKFTADEIKLLHFQNDSSPLEELKKRKAVGLFYDSRSKKTEILPEKKVRLFLDVMNPDKSVFVVKDKAVSGSIANPGVATGKVKIILGRPDFHKFNTGDILIAPMTSVDFVPLMQRAAAFVTNEGGITSHASIVSREMNKPCVIGTKIATKVFKDGDLVEVDANKGTVKKISRL